MIVTSHVVFDPTIAIRIASSTLAVATLLGVVAACIAVGVVVGRQSNTNPFVQKKTVFRSDISVAINRLITSLELQEFYDATATLNDLVTSLNAQIKLYFPQTAIKVVISAFSGQPILVSDVRKKKKRQQDMRPSIVTVNGSAYFTQNYTSNQIRTALYNYTRTIILDSLSYGPSPALGTFSSKYSVFTDTYPTGLTEDQVNGFMSISTSVSNVTANPG